MSTAKLFTYRATEKPLAEALREFAAVASEPLTALVYAPGWCGFAVLRDGQLRRPQGLVSADAFEVRAFTPTVELRWLKDARTGKPLAAVILSEKELTLKDWNRIPSNPRDAVIDTNPTTYLLWGTSTTRELPDGWSELGTARIGALPVPLAAVPEGRRVTLHAVEYLATDEFGSAYVIDERLTELKVTNG